MGTKLRISLTDEQARLIKEAVASGDYASSSEVIRDALRAWREQRIPSRSWDDTMPNGAGDDTDPTADARHAARRYHGAS